MHSTRKSELAILAALILTVLVFIFAQVHLSDIQQSIQRRVDLGLQISEQSGEIRYYDEVLTMSSQVAAHSGDPLGIWRQRHALSAQLLDEAIRKSTMASTEDVIEQIDRVSKQIVSIENLVFASIAKGEQDKALALLRSDAYSEQKDRYNTLNYELQNLLAKTAHTSRKAIRESQRHAKQFTLIIVVLLSVLWVYVLNRAARWRRDMISSNTQLTEMAHYDNLTGLANRTLFNQRLTEAIDQAHRTGLSLALIIIDVDKFKEINDSFGHVAGDELLKAVGKRLQTRARLTDTVARLGGDEFAIILTNIKDNSAVHTFANDMINDARQDVLFENIQFCTGQSIGIALYPDDADSVHGLMQKADFALYQAKQAGRGTYRLFDQQLEEKVQHKKRMQEDIAQSIASGHFVLKYQPLIDISSKQLKGVEVLVRWYHPERGAVAPDEFVPIAEESGLIIELGDWVLKRACQQQVNWRDRGLGDLVLSVNLSPIQFQNPSLVPTIKQTVQSCGMSPGMLELEITESGIMEKGESVVELLRELNEFGLKLAIDDFGTGYSSLAYLKHFPVHHLKIDRDFVTELPHNADDAAIARTIISMGKTLKLKVIAEGVETEEQLQFLRTENCDYAQGYYISEPLSATEFERWYIERYNKPLLSLVSS